jgi:hypothetical protein
MKSLNDRIIDKINKHPLATKEQVLLESYQNYKSSHYNMKQRLYDRIYNMNKKGAYFITLTFKNEPDLKTTKNLMKSWAYKNCSEYVCNIDYGNKNNRIHIHCVCVPKHLLHNRWKHGAINILKVKNSKNDERKAIMYITKLLNHSIKENTSNIIRSRERRKQ